MSRRDKPGHQLFLGQRLARARVVSQFADRRLIAAARRDGMWIGIATRHTPGNGCHAGIIISPRQARRWAQWILDHLPEPPAS